MEEEGEEEAATIRRARWVVTSQTRDVREAEGTHRAACMAGGAQSTRAPREDRAKFLLTSGPWILSVRFIVN